MGCAFHVTEVLFQSEERPHPFANELIHAALIQCVGSGPDTSTALQSPERPAHELSPRTLLTERVSS
jgi:hypothetical protein